MESKKAYSKRIDRLTKQWVIHFVVLMFAVFLHITAKEDGNTAILGTIEYMPYIFSLSVINIVLVGTGLYFIKSANYKFLTIAFTTSILLICYIVRWGDITILYWKIRFDEFVGVNVILIVLNAFTVYREASGSNKK